MREVLVIGGIVAVTVACFLAAVHEFGEYCEDINPYSACDGCMGGTFGDCEECINRRQCNDR